jgi:hypothetical protein
MNNTKYKYDVAFSFLAEDEPIVDKINTLVKGRLRTFMYFERQADIAGKDGEETFNQVFGSDARIVIVLYRENWGQTHWTRIEETAIRNRAFEEGYDFTLFIPLDPNHTVPKWLPKTQLWYGLDRWGIQGAASVIESKIQGAGGDIHETTVTEDAAVLAQEIDEAKNENKFLNSPQGVASANTEVQELFAQVKKLSEEASNQDIKIEFAMKNDECVAYSNGVSLLFVWIYQYNNSLEESELLVRFLKGIAQPGGHCGHYRDTERPVTLKQWQFNYGLDNQEHKGWRESSDSRLFRTSTQLAGYSLKELLARIRQSYTARPDC